MEITNSSTVMDPFIEQVLVKCQEENLTVYENTHQVILKSKVSGKLNQTEGLERDEDNLGILMLAIDSMPLTGFERAMPKVYSYMEVGKISTSE